MYSAGNAYLTVVPSFLNVEAAFRREAEKLGKTFEDSLDKHTQAAFGKAASNARRGGQAAGQNYAGAFAAEIEKRLSSGSAKFTFDPDVDLGGAELAIEEIQSRLETLRDIKIGVDLSEAEFFDEVAQVQAMVDALNREDVTIEVRTNASRLGDELAGIQGLRTSAEQAAAGAEDGDTYGGAFMAAVRRRVTAAKEALGEVDLTLVDPDMAAEVAAIRARMDRLLSTRIDVDLDVPELLREVAEVETALRVLAAQTVDVRIRTNALQALAEIEAFQKLAGVGAATPEDGARDGAEYGGAFGESAHAAIDAALRAIGPIRLDADSGPVDRALARIVAELEALRNVRVGVDMDINTFVGRWQAVMAMVEELDGQDPNVDVHVNLIRAMAELGTFQAMIDRLRLERVDVHVDTDADTAGRSLQELAGDADISFSRLGALIAVGALIGTAIVPAAAAAAAAIDGIATAAAGAGAGIGVFLLGIVPVISAVTALDRAQKSSAKSGGSHADTANRVASALDSQANAEQSLRKAEDARREAVAALSAAEEDARRKIEDLTQSLRSNSISQRQATLDVRQAKEDLDKILANPRATRDEREQAQITFDQKSEQLAELQTQGRRLAADQADAVKKGVSGSDQVVAAQKKIQNATDSVASAQRQLAASQRQLAQAYKTTGSTANAALTNAQRAMDALTPAGRRFALFLLGLKGDFKQLQQAAEDGMLPGLQTAIESLLPYFPALKNFVSTVAVALGNAFVYVANAMKDPVFQRLFSYLASTAAPVIEGLATVITNVAKGLAGIWVGLSGFNTDIGSGLIQLSEDFARWGSSLGQNQGWKHFLEYVQVAGPKVIDFFVQLWTFAKKLVEAAAPIGVVVLGALTGLIKLFNSLDVSTWTTLLSAIAAVSGALLIASGVMSFIAAGPVVWIITAIVLAGAALVILYQKVGWFRNFVNAAWKDIATWSIWLWANVLKPVFGFIGEAIQAWAKVLVWAWKNVYIPVFKFLGEAIEVWAAIVVWAWQNVVVPTFNAVATVVLWLWSNVIKPVFGFIGGAFSLIASTALWTWRNVFEPAFHGIAEAIAWAWAKAQPIFEFLGAAFKVISAVALWMWHNVFEPLLTGLAIGWQVLWAILQVIFGLIEIAFKLMVLNIEVIWRVLLKPVLDGIVWFVQSVLAPIFMWFWHNVIEPVWNGVYNDIKKVWETLLKPIFEVVGLFIKERVVPLFKSGVDALIAIWNSMKEAAKIPIKFIIDTVLNDGLLYAYNWVAKQFGVHPDDVRIPLPKGFASGGYVFGAGGPTDDAILARLSNGEYVIPADIVRQYGVRFFDSIIGRSGVPGGLPGDGSQGLLLPGFAAGGLVPGMWSDLQTIWNNRPDPIKYVRDKVAGLLDKVPGFGWAKADVVGAAQAAITKTIDFLTAHVTNQVSSSGRYIGPISGDIKAVQDWIRSQAGKPYVWAAAGPGGYDCCIIGTVRIYGPEGAKQIRDVRAGDRVYSYVDGKLEAHTVTAAWQSVHQPVFAVRTRNRTVTASANHPFMRVVEVGQEVFEHREDVEWAGLIERYRSAAECNVSACGNPVRANGLCGKHRERWRKHGDPRIVRVSAGTAIREDALWPGVPTNDHRGYRGRSACTVSACPDRVHANGMCAKHQERWRKHGDPRITLSQRAMFDVQWARLDELRAGDRLVQPRRMPTEAVLDAVLPDGTAVDQDVAWLIGALVGDGHVHTKGVALCMFGEDRERAVRIIHKRWGSNPTRTATQGLTVSAVQLRDLLVTMGMKVPGPDKQVPAAVWAWQPDLQRAFLDGYCDADGHRPANQKRHGERTYSSASRELVEGVRALHTMLGDAVSNITVTTRTKPITIRGKIVKNARNQHVFAVWPNSGRGESVFRNHPGLAEWLDSGDFTLTSVLSVTPMGEQDTWDLEVEEAHNFIADGVVVHNSGMQSAVWNLLHNKNPYSHTFSTANEAQFFPISGHGQYTVGFAGPGEQGGGRVGHTAGNLAGLPFVSRGGDGVVVGPRTESVDSFAHVGHYDSGGLAQPGWTAMFNGTSAPEPVLTGSQWQDISALAAAGGGGRPGNTYQFEFRDTTLDPGKLRALQDREAALARQGRAR